MTSYDMYGKTELLIKPINLRDVDLNEIAAQAARVLNLPRAGILVTDVLDGQLVLDVLHHGVDASDLVGQADNLLTALSKVPGVVVLDETQLSSRGMLSWIQADSGEGQEALRLSEEMASRIQEAVRKRVMVFSTGAEVESRQVLDTNGIAIKQVLTDEGYVVTLGATLKDDDLFIAANLNNALEQGFGLVITTGGVGAEDKDRTIEAVLRVDPDAATEVLVKYELGVGRHHHKDSVRIAVGEVGDTYLVALPGPNDEVRAALAPLVAALAQGDGKREIAQKVAKELRERLRLKSGSTGPSEGHAPRR